MTETTPGIVHAHRDGGRQRHRRVVHPAGRVPDRLHGRRRLPMTAVDLASTTRSRKASRAPPARSTPRRGPARTRSTCAARTTRAPATGAPSPPSSSRRRPTDTAGPMTSGLVAQPEPLERDRGRRAQRHRQRLGDRQQQRHGRRVLDRRRSRALHSCPAPTHDPQHDGPDRQPDGDDRPGPVTPSAAGRTRLRPQPGRRGQLGLPSPRSPSRSTRPARRPRASPPARTPTTAQLGQSSSNPSVRVTATFDDTASGGSGIAAGEGFIEHRRRQRDGLPVRGHRRRLQRGERDRLRRHPAHDDQPAQHGQPHDLRPRQGRRRATGVPRPRPSWSSRGRPRRSSASTAPIQPDHGCERLVDRSRSPRASSA